jgi:energy-converting hydrogenase Eha subunit E
MSSVASDVVDSIFTPGVNDGVIYAMNVSFYLLFVSLVFLLVLSEFNVYVLFLTLTSVALFATIQLFMAQIRQPQEKQE